MGVKGGQGTHMVLAPSLSKTGVEDPRGAHWESLKEEALNLILLLAPGLVMSPGHGHPKGFFAQNHSLAWTKTVRRPGSPGAACASQGGDELR